MEWCLKTQWLVVSRLQRQSCVHTSGVGKLASSRRAATAAHDDRHVADHVVISRSLDTSTPTVAVAQGRLNMVTRRVSEGRVTFRVAMSNHFPTPYSLLPTPYLSSLISHLSSLISHLSSLISHLSSLISHLSISPRHPTRSRFPAGRVLSAVRVSDPPSTACRRENRRWPVSSSAGGIDADNLPERTRSPHRCFVQRRLHVAGQELLDEFEPFGECVVVIGRHLHIFGPHADPLTRQQRRCPQLHQRQVLLLLARRQQSRMQQRLWR